MKIGVIHTVPRVRDDLKRRLAELPELSAVHLSVPHLLSDLQSGVPEPVVRAHLAEIIREFGEVDLVVASCSSLTPSVQRLREDSAVAVLAIDEPLAQRAAATPGRIGLVCTTTTTVQPSTQLIERHAHVAGTEGVSIVPLFVEGAFAALSRGDQGEHDLLVTRAVMAARDSVDRLVLAQASLAHLEVKLEQTTGLDTFSSPRLLVDELRHRSAAS